MDESTHSFALWLRHRRQALHLTQRRLGELAYCSEAMIRKIEADERWPSREVAQHLAVALQVPERDREQFLRWARGEYVHDPLSQAATETAIERPVRAPFDVPAPPNALIGRQADLVKCVALLKQSDVRLVTLTGTGGVGKTRLGIAIAEALRDVFVDGVFFVNLAPVSDPTLVLATIAATLGIKEMAGHSLLASLQAALHDRHILLLVDNFEQVLGAGTVVADLLRATPSVKVLVTSRASLRVQGEHEMLVKPLPVPATRTMSPDIVAECDATRLFIERAQSIQVDFAMTSHDAQAIADICARLDGLPLAIELAAARVKVLPPQVLLRRLDEQDYGGFHTLTSRARDVHPRQQTLHATIEWSYKLLDAAEQTLFVRLAVFVGGWTLEAAEAVCHASGGLDRTVLDVLESLIDKHLVRSVAPVGEQPRFGMFQTIREYMLEHLESSGMIDNLRQRHALYFRDLAEMAALELRGPRQRMWLTHLEVEHDNLRTALQWSLDRSDDETAMRLLRTLNTFWWMRGHFQEGLHWLEKVLSEGDSIPVHVRAEALHATGWFLQLVNHKQAEVMYRESLALYKELDDKLGIAELYYSLAGRAHVDGNDIQARYLYEESLSLYHEVGDKRGVATVLDTLGALLSIHGDYVQAKEFHHQSLALRRELGDEFGIALCLNSLGHVASSEGHYTEATMLYEESLTIRRALGEKPGIARSLGNLANAWTAQGDYDQATRLNYESMALALEIGYKRAVAIAQGQLGWALSEQGEHEDAINVLKANLAFWRELGEERGTVECLERLASALALAGQATLALQLFGATTAWREAHEMPRLGVTHRSYDRAIHIIRTQLDPRTFVTATEEGREMTLDQASTRVEVIRQQNPS